MDWHEKMHVERKMHDSLLFKSTLLTYANESLANTKPQDGICI